MARYHNLFTITLVVILSSVSTVLLGTITTECASVAGGGRRPPPRPRVGRAFFVFGDSLVDYGNNNYLATTARADSPPYGIDYPTHHPTGRFSNGLNMPDQKILIDPKFDIEGEHLGMKTVLAYLDPNLKGDKLLLGANFASAGVGILNDTAELAMRSNGGECVAELERAAAIFNPSLTKMVLDLNNKIGKHVFIAFFLVFSPVLTQTQ